MPAGDQHAPVGETLGIGTMQRERAHLRRRPGGAVVAGEGDKAGDAGGVVFAQHAGQLAARARTAVGTAVQKHQRPFAESMVAIVRHLRRLAPRRAAVVRQRQDLGKLLAVRPHDVREHGQLAVAQLQHAVRLEAHDAGFHGRPPGTPVIAAPPRQVGGRLVGVEVTVVVTVAQHHQPAVAEAAQARGHQALFPGLQVGARHLGLLVPGAAAVIAGQQGEDHEIARPMAIGIGVYQQHPLGGQTHDVGVLGESSGTAPDVERGVMERVLGYLHCADQVTCGTVPQSRVPCHRGVALPVSGAYSEGHE